MKIGCVNKLIAFVDVGPAFDPPAQGAGANTVGPWDAEQTSDQLHIGVRFGACLTVAWLLTQGTNPAIIFRDCYVSVVKREG